MDHALTRATLLPTIIQMIMNEYGMDENQALDAFYRSGTGVAFSDDETGLYGQSALYTFGLFCEEMHWKAHGSNVS